jgi:hypothetical protein
MRSVGLLGLACAAVLAGEANAAPITFVFTATVTGSFNAPSAPVGATATGAFTFDSAAGANITGPGFVRYLALDSVSFQIPATSYSDSFVASGTDFIEVSDRASGAATDAYRLLASTSPPNFSFGMQLVGDPLGDTLVASTALPLTPPDLSLAVSRTGTWTFNAGNSGITFTLDTLTLLPEPASALLLGSAALALVALRWRSASSRGGDARRAIRAPLDVVVPVGRLS